MIFSFSFARTHCRWLQTRKMKLGGRANLAIILPSNYWIEQQQLDRLGRIKDETMNVCLH